MDEYSSSIWFWFIIIVKHFVPEWVSFSLFLIWVSWWVFKTACCVNDLPHSEQRYALSPVWINSCFFKPTFRRNVLSQFRQAYGCFPECISWCLIKPLLSENTLSHFEQVYFPPVWITSWSFNSNFCLNLRKDCS